MMITLVHSNCTKDGMLHVHAAGCADVAKYGRGRRAGEVNDLEVDSFKDLVLDWYGDCMSDTYAPDEYDAHWEEYAGEFRILSCAKTLA